MRVSSFYNDDLNAACNARHAQMETASTLYMVPDTMRARACLGAKHGRDVTRYVTGTLVGPAWGEPQRVGGRYAEFYNRGGIVGSLTRVAVTTLSVPAMTVASAGGSICGSLLPKQVAKTFAAAPEVGAPNVEANSNLTGSLLGAVKGCQLMAVSLGWLGAKTAGVLTGTGGFAANVLQGIAGIVLGAVYGLGLGFPDGLRRLASQSRPLVPADGEGLVPA